MVELLNSIASIPKIIESCTVPVRREVIGNIVCYHCSSPSLELLEMATQQIFNRTDKELHPVISVPQYCLNGYNSTVSFYKSAELVPPPYNGDKNEQC